MVKKRPQNVMKISGQNLIKNGPKTYWKYEPQNMKNKPKRHKKRAQN